MKCSTRSKVLSSAATATIIALSGAAPYSNASSISVKFGYEGMPIAASDTAGYSPVSGKYWNYVDVQGPTSQTTGSATGGSGALVDNSSMATTAVVSYGSIPGGKAFGQSSNESTFANSGDLHLYEGDIGINTDSASGYNTLVLTVSVPTVYTSSGYDIYIYWECNNTGGTQYSISDGTTTLYNYATDNDTSLSSYVLSTTNSLTTTPSNLAAFYETASTVTFDLLGPTTGNAGQIFGLQIVQTPEPAPFAVLSGIGVVSLLRRRRVGAEPD